MAFHRELGDNQIHVIFDQTYTNNTTRDNDTAWNGLAENVGKCVFVSNTKGVHMLLSVTPTWFDFGGSVSAPDTIYTADEDLSGSRHITGPSARTLTLQTLDLLATTYGTGAELGLTSTSAEISAFTGTGAGTKNEISRIQINQTSMQVLDQIQSTGLVYGADYSALGALEDRWIPDKAWVESHVGSAAGGTLLGEIQYNDGTGALQAETTFFWDTVNKRLGLNKAAPATSLHIYEDTAGTSSTNGLMLEQGGLGGCIQQFLLTGLKRWSVGLENLNGTVNGVRFLICSGSNQLDNERAISIDKDENVGIGNYPSASDIQARLTVYDNNALSGAETGLLVWNAGDGDAQVQYLIDGRRWVSGIDNSDNDSWKLAPTGNVGTDTIFTATTAGKVGVGTAAPSSPLHVYESTTQTGSAAGLTIQNVGGGDSVAHFRAPTHTWTIGVDVDDDEHFKIDAATSLSGLPYFSMDVDGNLGIGISAAGSRLHVYDNDAVTGATGGLTIEQAGLGDALLHLKLAGQEWTMGADNSAGDFFKLGTGSDLSAARLTLTDTATNAALRITLPSGTGDAALELHGRQGNQGSAHGDIRFLNWDSTGGTQNVENAFIRAHMLGTTEGAGGKLLFGTSPDATGAVERMVIDNDGKVGIGIGVPLHALHIEVTNTDADTAIFHIDQAGTGASLMEFTAPGIDYFIGIDTNDGNKFKIASGGIGSAEFHVHPILQEIGMLSDKYLFQDDGADIQTTITASDAFGKIVIDLLDSISVRHGGIEFDFVSDDFKIDNTVGSIVIDLGSNAGQLEIGGTAHTDAHALMNWAIDTADADIYVGDEAPTGLISAVGGSFYFRDQSASSGLYVKKSTGGASLTGWERAALFTDEEMIPFIPHASPAVNVEGQVFYDSTAQALSVSQGNGVTCNLGKEMFLPDMAVNDQGGDIVNGQAVYISGSDGTNPQVKLAKADAAGTSHAVGLVTEATVTNGSQCYVTTYGLVRDLDTSTPGWTAGDLLYLSDTTAGGLTNVKPVHPSLAHRIGIVVAVSLTDGSIFVSIPVKEDVTGSRPVTKSYSIPSAPATTKAYSAGFYEYETSSKVLDHGGGATSEAVIGTLNRAIGAHVFVVTAASGTGSAATLKVHGNSVDSAGNRTVGDVEVLILDTDGAALDDYYETEKKFVGEVDIILSDGTGTLGINYGFAKYEDFGSLDFTVTDFEAVGKADGNSDIDIILWHHSATGWVYAATGFAPSPPIICQMTSDYSSDDQLGVSDEYFAYKRSGLNITVDGSMLEGVVISYEGTGTNKLNNANFHIGVLL